jgi:hypothetical protein
MQESISKQLATGQLATGQSICNMANALLFSSSVVCGIINLILFLLCECYYNHIQGGCPKKCQLEIRIMEILTMIIIVSSLLNHGYSDVWYKWFDRVMVYISLVIYVYISWKYNVILSMAIIIGSCILYVIAKMHGVHECHAMVHLLMTLNNLILYVMIP